MKTANLDSESAASPAKIHAAATATPGEQSHSEPSRASRPSREPLLKVEGLNINFQTRAGLVKVLKNVCLDIQPGEIVGLVGESGSGKSVFSFSLLQQLGPNAIIDGGKMLFRGRDLLALPKRERECVRGREIAMIFQNYRVALNPIRTVGAQIMDVLRQHEKLGAREARARALDLLAEVRIHDPKRRFHAYPFELSGGMCQRVMIALALSCRPGLLIADEPTTGLDVTTQGAVMDLILGLARDHHTATMLITHDLAVAADYCERINVMQGGHIVESAPSSRLFTVPQHAYTQALLAATPAKQKSIETMPVLTEEVSGNATAPAPLPPAEKMPRLEKPERLLFVDHVHKKFEIGQEGSFFDKLRGRATPTILHAVNDVTFEIAAGESVGLVGESGCGKSTLVKLLTRLEDPTAGHILFKGAHIGDIPAGEFARRPERRLVQMVFQDATDSLNPRMSIFDSMAEPLRLLCHVRNSAELRQRMEEMADLVRLPRVLLDRYPHQLSGGQRARAGIGRALIAEPALLILDEPTAALDVSVQAVILKLLVELRERLNVAYLFVSHDLHVVRLLCSKVVVMCKGEVVEAGETGALFDHPQHEYTKSLIAAVPCGTRMRQQSEAA